MKDKIIKSLSIAFEVDELDLNSTEGNKDLSRKLTSNYPFWAKVIKVTLEVIELEDNLNSLFLYNLVIMADSSLTSVEDMKNSWNSLTTLIEEAMEEFLKLNSITYKKLS